jgi:hypothetical protein
MGQRRKPDVTGESAPEQDMRDQEVLRANRELAAYFKGQRTEREARAALKIIKALVRDRERRDAKRRPPLPGVNVGKMPKEATVRKGARDAGEQHRRKRRRKSSDKASGSAAAASIEPQVPMEPSELSELDERSRG